MKKVTIKVPDMQSAHCQVRVKNAIKEIAGMKIQDLEAGKIIASVASDHVKDEIISAIEKAGYTVVVRQ